MVSFIFFRHISNIGRYRTSPYLPRGLEGPWVRAEVLSLRLDVSLRNSTMRSQNFSSCFVEGSVAALICRTTSSHVMGTLAPAAALQLSSTSLPSKRWVSSPVILWFTSPAPILNHKMLQLSKNWIVLTFSTLSDDLFWKKEIIGLMRLSSRVSAICSQEVIKRVSIWAVAIFLSLMTDVLHGWRSITDN